MFPNKPLKFALLKFCFSKRSKDYEEGFTPLDLFFVVLVLGVILFALVFILPSFLNPRLSPAYRSRLHGRNSTSAMNRVQQAYILEQGVFANTFEEMGLGIESVNENYQYSTVVRENIAINYAISHPYHYQEKWFGPFSWEVKVEEPLVSFVGGVFKLEDDTLTVILCQTLTPTNVKLNEPILVENQPVCGEGTEQLP